MGKNVELFVFGVSSEYMYEEAEGSPLGYTHV